MFDTVTALEQAIDSLTIPADEAVLARVVRAMSTLQAKLTAAVAVFDENKLWDINGATSMTGWLRDHGMTGPAGKHVSGVAAKTAALPVTSAAWTEGKLSVGQVDVITAHLRDQRYVALFAEHEAAVVPAL